MALVFRHASIGDLERAEELVVLSINNLTTRHGFGSIATSRAPDFQAFCLHDDPRGVWVAQDDEAIVGFALSWVCDDLWFLAELFVAPERQGLGIGNELLLRTMRHAVQRGAGVKGLITFAFNVVSQGLYVQHGLSPRIPIHLCSLDRDSLARHHPSRLMSTPAIHLKDEDFATLQDLDVATLGVSREKHHRYLLNDTRMHGLFLDDGDRRVGYVYVSDSGHIGPFAVKDSYAISDAFTTALTVALEIGSTRITVFAPGSSPALNVAAQHGMKFVLPMVLMSTRDFGDWAGYCPRNPGFM